MVNNYSESLYAQHSVIIFVFSTKFEKSISYINQLYL